MKMRKANLFCVVPIVLAILVMPGCTEDGSLDDGDAANVLLQILGVTNPAVTGEATLGTCSISLVDCLTNDNCGELGGTCTPPVATGECTVNDWTIQMRNAAKSEGAVNSPFNDIFLSMVTITYDDLDGTEYAPDSEIAISVTIPAASEVGFSIAPIAFNEIDPDDTTINLTMTFTGTTVAGTAVAAIAAAQLFIEDCNGVPVP